MLILNQLLKIHRGAFRNFRVNYNHTSHCQSDFNKNMGQRVLAQNLAVDKRQMEYTSGHNRTHRHSARFQAVPFPMPDHPAPDTWIAEGKYDYMG